jgi:hypothetical protein
MSRYARRQSVKAVAARSAGARSASLDAAKAISDLTATRSRRRGRSTDDGISSPSAFAVLPAHLSFVNDAERSRVLHTSLKQDLSHGSEPGKPHSRARLRDLDLAWLRTRSGRSALADRRAGNLEGIDGHAPRQARPTNEAPVACTFKITKTLARAS